MSLIQVTLLTGFLGSGKTTLLGQALSDPRFENTAVIVNEFGEVGLDGALVEHSEEQVVEMTSGCLCCTIRGDISGVLLDLHARREKKEVPSFTRVVVETTGLADPAPVIHTLMTDWQLIDRYSLNGIVTVVDVVNVERSMAYNPECVKQIAVADRIILTKSDLLPTQSRDSGAERVIAVVRQVNPGAHLQDIHGPGFNLDKLFDASLYDPNRKTSDVRRWLNAEAYNVEAEKKHIQAHAGHDAGHGHHHGHRHDHGADAHDINRHGPDIHAHCMVLDRPISSSAFAFALQLLIANQGEDLLRVKGIVHVREKPDTPAVIHGVQHVFHDPVWLDAWPDDDRRTKIVFIVRNISGETIERFFRAWQDADEEDVASASHRAEAV